MNIYYRKDLLLATELVIIIFLLQTQTLGREAVMDEAVTAGDSAQVLQEE